jgi:hypothetical protein
MNCGDLRPKGPILLLRPLGGEAALRIDRIRALPGRERRIGSRDCQAWAAS